METSLLKITWIKEKKHWKRTFDVFGKFKNWFGKITLGVILAIVGTVVHYAFVSMSTLWQSLMFFINRKKFKINLQRQLLKL